MENKEQNKVEQDTINPRQEYDLKNIEAGDDALIFITVAFLILLVIMYTLVSCA